MKTEELARLAHRLRSSLPNVEMFSLAAIYRILREKEKATMSLLDFKEFIHILTGWDISFQIIKRQLEINQIWL